MFWKRRLVNWWWRMERREVHCGSTVARSNIHGLKSRNFLQSLWTELKTYETLNDFEIVVDRQDCIWLGGFLEWKEPAEWRKYAIELWISAWGVWLTPPIRVLFHSFSQPPQSPTMPFKLSATLQAHQDSVRGHFLQSRCIQTNTLHHSPRLWLPLHQILFFQLLAIQRRLRGIDPHPRRSHLRSPFRPSNNL